MKYKALYDALKDRVGLLFDVHTGRVETRGFGVDEDISLPSYFVADDLPEQDAEAWDTMVERALAACRQRAATHLLVVKDAGEGKIFFTPSIFTLSREFALGYASAYGHSFIWNAEKGRPLFLTEKMEQQFWVGGK